MLARVRGALRSRPAACRKRNVTNPSKQLSALERVDLALASRMVGAAADDEPLAVAQRPLAGLRRPAPADPVFLASLLRLRGFVLDDGDVADVLAGRQGRLSPITQEHRLLRGLQECLRLIRLRAADGLTPDGWFLVDLFRTMTAELPRFRNNELRRGPPWDGVNWLAYPAPEQLRAVLDTFDLQRCYRDVPLVFHGLHPVRQGFRLMWRFARVAPFPDFNVVLAWLGMNAWLQAKGFPLLRSEQGDQALLSRVLTGPPPTKMPPFEARLLSALGDLAA
jgi:hypothetical protein